MTLQEIIAAESRNTDKIYLHLEGIFWKAYERSAFAFIHRISRYKASKRFIKYLDTKVVSLGFPDASRPKVLGDRPLVQANDDLLLLDVGAIDPEEYGRWKDALPLIVPKPATPTVAPVVQSYSAYAAGRSSIPVPDEESVPLRVTVVEPPQLLSAASIAASSANIKVGPESDLHEVRNNEAVLRDLRNFSVENATPLECLIFVSSLKKQLNGNI